MAEPLVDVSIARNTSIPKVTGFNTMIFVGRHRWFPERVREYTSKEALAADMPTDSNEYIAGNLAFSQEGAPGSILIGRRESDATLTPSTTTADATVAFTITVNDGDSALVSYTVGAGETEQDICTALKGVIDADASIAAHVTATVTGTGAAAVLDIEATTTSDVFYLTNLSNLTYAFTSLETAADLVAAITLEDSSWYAIASDDHTETFVLGMAAALEGTERLYFVSSQEIGAISSYSEASTDVLAKLVQANYFNTVPVWHHEADTNFIEVGYFAISGRYTPGTVTWVNLPIAGITAARNPSTGNLLSSTERGNLDDRNASYLLLNVLGTYTLEGGRVSGGGSGNGEWLDNMRFPHYWAARLREGVGAVMLNQRGRKLGGDNGISKIHGACNTVSDRELTTPTESRGLDSYRFTFKRNKDLTPAERASRVCTGTFVGYLTGAFHKAKIEGIVTYAGL